MEHRPSRTTAQKIQYLLPVLVIPFVLYALATHDYLMPLSIALTLLILRLAMNPSWVYRWLNRLLAYLGRPKPTIFYYQPSQQSSQEQPSEQSSYERGYQEQPYYQPTQEQPAQPVANAEQPQAQYPEQMPPMR